MWVLQLMSKHSSRRNLAHARYTAKLANEVTRELVQSKSAALYHGQGNKDILSLLGRPLFILSPDFQLSQVKANMSHDAKNKLTEEEMLAQVR